MKNHMKQTIITIMLALFAMTGQAQVSNPKGLYKLKEIVHQDGKHLEAPFKQYKFCQDSLTLMLNYNEPWLDVPFDFTFFNNKLLVYTGELSKTENKGVQIFDTTDSTFTLRWFNEWKNIDQHLFPYGTNIDELYELVTDSTDNIRKVLNILQTNPEPKQHRLLGAWKLRGWKKDNIVTSQYWIEREASEQYMVFGSNGTVSFQANDRFPKANLHGYYLPCKYLSDNVVDLKDMTYMVNWFDYETISIMTLDDEGRPIISVWDRCGLPENYQLVFGGSQAPMKKDISRFMRDEFEKRYGTQPDSICKAYETFNYAVDVTEKNNAIFPVLMKCGFEGEYKTMRDALLEELMSGKKTAEEAVSHYVFWFYKNFDRHTTCSTQTFLKLQQECHPDYNNLIGKYAPEPVGRLVDKETYLLRLPSCEGEVPTMEWVKKKAEEFKQSGCKYLILDLRGNTGGGDDISLVFTYFMCDCSAMNDEEYFYRVSTENDKQLKKRCEKVPGNYFDRVWEESKTAEDGSLIMWGSSPKGGFEYKPLVRKGAIIVDANSASAAETPVRFVHNHSKTHAKVYGRDNTCGAEQTGNCNDIRLPHSNIFMHYPMTVDDTFEKQCRDKNPGYKPDVIIPLPYPKKLTDNIDEWVLWVAKDLKKSSK